MEIGRESGDVGWGTHGLILLGGFGSDAIYLGSSFLATPATYFPRLIFGNPIQWQHGSQHTTGWEHNMHDHKIRLHNTRHPAAFITVWVQMQTTNIQCTRNQD